MPGSDREIRLDLLARDKTGPATRSASENLDDVATAADKAGDSTEKLGKASDKSADRVKRLDREIGLLEHELKGLNAAYADAETDAERADLGKGIRKMEGDLRKLKKVKGFLPDPEPEAKSFVAKLGTGIVGGIGSISGKLGGSVGPTVGGSIGAAAAPYLAASLATALSAGLGAGVIGGAIALALADDDKLADVAAQTGQKFMFNLTKGIRGTGISTEIQQSLGVLADAGTRVTTKFVGTIKALQGDIVPLTRDIVQAVESIVNAVLGVAAKSGPALAGFGDGIRLIADGVGDFLTLAADGGPEAANSFVMLSGVIADTLRWTGLLVKAFNELSSNAWVTGPWMQLLKKHYKEAAEESDTLAGSQTRLNRELDNGEKAARGQTDALQGLAKEMKSQADPVFGLMNALDTLTEKQKAAKEAVKEHGKNSKEADKATRELAMASIDLQGKVGALGNSFNGTLTPAMRATLKAGGLTEKQIDNIEKQFREAKASGDKYSKRYQAAIGVTGYSTVMKQFNNVQDQIREIPRAVTIAMRITGSKSVSASAAAIRKQYEARADGGPVRKGNAYIVGDGGRPEVFVPDRDGTIVPSIEQYAKSGGGGQMGSGWLARATPNPGRPAAMLVSGGGSNNWLWEAVQYGINNGYIRVA